MSAYLGSMKVWDSTTTSAAAAAAAADWIRPASWLAMPTIAPTEQRIVGLHCIWPTDGNFCALTCSGNYTVDWGDGETETRTAGQPAYHEYVYTNANLNSATVATHGYKQALVTITPQSGQNLTNVNFFVKHNQSGLMSGYATGWLDIAFSAPYCTALTFSSTASTVAWHRLIERFVVVKCGNINVLANTFYNCSSLQSVDLGGLSGAPITSLSGTFYACNSLQSVDLTGLSGAPITSVAYAFYNCYALQSVDLTPLTGAPITSLLNTFYNCFSLQSVDLTPLSGAPITTMVDTFYGCPSLAKLIAPVPVSLSVWNSRFSANALNALYSSLRTGVTGKIVNVNGNYGVTGDNPSLVPTGWTVSG